MARGRQKNNINTVIDAVFPVGVPEQAPMGLGFEMPAIPGLESPQNQPPISQVIQAPPPVRPVVEQAPAPLNFDNLFPPPTLPGFEAPVNTNEIMPEINIKPEGKIQGSNEVKTDSKSKKVVEIPPIDLKPLEAQILDLKNTIYGMTQKYDMLLEDLTNNFEALLERIPEQIKQATPALAPSAIAVQEAPLDANKAKSLFAVIKKINNGIIASGRDKYPISELDTTGVLSNALAQVGMSRRDFTLTLLAYGMLEVEPKRDASGKEYSIEYFVPVKKMD